MAIVKGKLFGYLEIIAPRVLIVDENQIEFPVLLVMKKLPPVAQILDKLPIALVHFRRSLIS